MVTAISTGTSVEDAANTAMASIKAAIVNTGLPNFWKGVSFEYFITRP